MKKFSKRLLTFLLAVTMMITKSFRKTDNTWINYSDVKEGDNYASKPCKVINKIGRAHV